MAALGSNMKGRSEKKATKASSTANPKKKEKPSVAKVTKPKAAAKQRTVAKPKKSSLPKAATPKPTTAKKAETAKPEKVNLENVLASTTATAEKESAPSTPTKKLRDAKLILEPSKRKKIRKIKVIMEGELNINNVDAFTQEIHPIFENFDYVDFLLREPSSVDLAHIQMLYYFQQFYAKKGKTVTIDSNMSAEVKKIVISSGFKDLMFIPKLV